MTLKVEEVFEQHGRTRGEEEAIRQSYSTMAESDMSAQEWKHKGCEESRKGNLSEALSYYSNALKLTEDEAEKACLYRNRADIYLQLSDYEKVINDCNSALKICCSKALLQRCKALEALERFEEAYQDAEIIIALNPNNEDFQRVVDHLREIVQERLCTLRVSEKLDLAFDVNAREKERRIAMNNLHELACDETGAEEIFKKEGVSKMVHLVKVEEDEEVICRAIRIVAELCKNNISRTESVMKYVGLPWFLEIMSSTSIERVNASQYCLQNILNTYSGMNNKPDSNRNEDLYEAHKKEIDTIMFCLSYSITSRTITGLARDAIIKLITHNIHYTALDWAKRFVELRGVQRLMEVAGEMEEYNSESLLDITSSTRTITSVCLEMVYKNVYKNCDDEKTFTNAVDEFIEDKLHSPDVQSKVRVVVAITTLLLSPLDVGNTFVVKEGILEMILVMAGMDDVLQQKVALECIVAAVTRKDKVDVIIKQGVNILKKLCQSQDDSLRVRALVAFCKMGNSGDSDATTTPFADGVTKELTEACRRLLINPKKENNEWAVKGLSYLTFNTGVKQELIGNREVIETMIDITDDPSTDDQSVLFDVLTTLMNLCNAYDEQEPEMIELSKFVKYHFPEEPELDDVFEDEGLIVLLMDYDVITYLLELAKTDNQNCKELIARVFNAICSKQRLVDVFAHVMPETLLSLALDGTVKGKKQASLALVHLALTKSIFTKNIVPAQLLTEFVQPIVNLLHLGCSVNENCQTLTALCNLAEVNDSIREHMFKEGVFQKIEAFVYEGDYLLKLASANFINIMILSREVAIKCFEQDNSRVDYLMLLYKDENQDIKFAAAAALVKLTVANKEACKKVLDSNFWLEFLRFLLTNRSSNVREMGLIFVLSIIKSMEDVTAKSIKTDIMELLRTLNNTVQNNHIKELKSIALEALAECSSRETFIVMLRWERDVARRSRGQSDLLELLEIQLWVYEHTDENLVPLNIWKRIPLRLRH
ncbi:Protein unc-45-like protein A [Temnothorax longispinosus]|uniref:Protein unc-45-like protein A n=1 Tax=Temnothorax longispinosus TaxID=300112 RepID=A0A4V3SBF7_9HYME|nr:Protein unc-45-like protein A [Temnothorax longispinosus]